MIRFTFAIITSFFLLIARANITISPDTFFQGDTVTIYCTFSAPGDISWYLNSSRPISDINTKTTGPLQKYNTSSNQEGTVVQYSLMIRNVNDTDKGESLPL